MINWNKIFGVNKSSSIDRVGERNVDIPASVGTLFMHQTNSQFEKYILNGAINSIYDGQRHVLVLCATLQMVNLIASILPRCEVRFDSIRRIN